MRIKFSSTLFQLHHTGIKTRYSLFRRVGRRYFNCTIQELKHCMTSWEMKATSIFQLHHTGIKTTELDRKTGGLHSFQLHHTGIKTHKAPLNTCVLLYFNCTIQELKQFWYNNSAPSYCISIAPYRN